MTNTRKLKSPELATCDQQIAALIAERDQCRSRIASCSGRLRSLRTKRQRLVAQDLVTSDHNLKITLVTGDTNSDHVAPQVTEDEYDDLLKELAGNFTK